MNDRLSILCVEDDADQRIIIARCLQVDPGIDVECAPSPADALDMACRFHPDLILLDISLSGGQSGVDLAEAMLDAGYDGAIIFLTASVRASERPRLSNDAFRGIIAKPFQPLALAGTIRSMMTH